MKFSYNARSHLTAILESFDVIIEKHTCTIKILRDDIISKIHQQLRCSALESRKTLRTDCTARNETEEMILKHHIMMFYEEISVIQKNLQSHLTDVCNRLDQTKQIFTEQTNEYRRELSEQQDIMMTRIKNDFIASFQEKRLHFLKNVIVQVHSHINDRMIEKEKQLNYLLLHKRKLNDKLIKLEIKRNLIMKKQKQLETQKLSLKLIEKEKESTQ